MKLTKELDTTSLIHLHTDIGSVGDGAGTINNYMERFKDKGVVYATLTDHGDLSGILGFYMASKKAGINPGIGCEVYLNDNRDAEKGHKDANKEDDNPDDFKNNHLILVAKNAQGVKNIIKINNEAVMNGFYRKPRTTTEKIFEMAGDDVLVSTGCLAGFPARMIMANRVPELKKRLALWKERFGDDLYIELQFNELQEQKQITPVLIKLSKELKIPLIVAQDCHYVDEGENFLQLIKSMKRDKKQLKDLEKGIPDGLWIFDAKELFVKSNYDVVKTAKQFNYDIEQNLVIDALVQNHEWHHKCNTHWDLSVKHYNKYQPPKEFKTAKQYFNHLIVESLKNFVEKKYIPKEKISDYTERVKYESKILIDKGYVDYLLETKKSIDELVETIGSETHVGIGRGSASASLCAYLLGIHKIDPIKHDLLFDRFLSEARSNEMIDIDL